jgi:hypothetical protein
LRDFLRLGVGAPVAWVAQQFRRLRASRARNLQFHIFGLAVLLIGGLVLPILIFPVPPLADFPNHLARIYTIASVAHDPLLARYYAVAWRLVPNLGFDAVMVPLTQAFGVFAAGKLFVVALVVMLPAGVIALHRALYRRASLWPLVSVLFVYNQDLNYGLLNYLLSTILALFGAALWIRLREASRLWRALVSLFFVAALFFCHFLGVGIYGMAIGCFELERWWRTRPPLRMAIADAATLLVPFVLVAPIILLSPTIGFASETSWAWGRKALGLYFVFKIDGRASSLIFAATACGALLWGLASGRIRVARVGWVFAALAAAVYLAMPNKLMSASLVDLRLPATFALFLIGFSDWEPRAAYETRRFAAAIVALLAAVVTAVVAQWSHYGRVIGEYERSFAMIDRGSRIFAAVNLQGADLTEISIVLHFPALAMIERSAMYSHAFTHPGQQPLALKEPYRETAPFDGLGLPVEELAAADVEEAGAYLRSIGEPRPVYWANWRANFDYLYVIHTPEGYEPPLHGLVPLVRNSDFALYRIEHPR